MRKFSKILALLLAVCLVGGVFALVASADATAPTLQLSGTGVKPGSIDENFRGTLNLAKDSKFYNGNNVDGQTVVQDYGYWRSSVPSIVTDGTDRYLMFTHKGSSVTSGNNYLRISPYGKWVATAIDGYYLNGQVSVTDFDMTAFDVDGDGIADAPASFNVKQIAVVDAASTKAGTKTVGISLGDKFSTVPGEWVHITVISFLNEDQTKVVVNVYANGEFVDSKEVTHGLAPESVAITYYNFAIEGEDVTANTSATPRFQFAFDHFTTNFYTPSTYVTKAEEGSDLTFANLIANPANAAPLYLYKDLVFYHENYDSYNRNDDVAIIDGVGYKYLDVAVANIQQNSVVTTKLPIENFKPNKGVTHFTLYGPSITFDPTVKNNFFADPIEGGFAVGPKDVTKFPIVFKYNDKIVAKGYINADQELVLPGYFAEDPSSGIFSKITSWVYDDPLDYDPGTLVPYTPITADDMVYLWENDGLDYDTMSNDAPVPLVFTAAEDAVVDTLTVTGYAQYSVTESGVAVLTSYANDVEGLAATLAEANIGTFTVYTNVETALTVMAGANVTLDMSGNKLAAAFAGEGTVTVKNAIVTAASLTNGSVTVIVGEGNKFYGTDLSALNTAGVTLIPANVVDDNGTLTAICSTVAGDNVIKVMWNDAAGELFFEETWFAGSVVTHPAATAMSDRNKFPLLTKAVNPYYGWCDTVNGWTASGALTEDTTFNIDANVFVPVEVNLMGIMYNMNIDTSFDIVAYAPIYYVKNAEGEFELVEALPEGLEFVGISGTQFDEYQPVGEDVNGNIIYAPAAYKSISMRKVADSYAPKFTFKVNGEEMSYTMPAITIGTYAAAIYAKSECGDYNATLMTAILNYCMGYEYENLTGNGTPSKATFAIYAAVNSKQNNDDLTPGAHHDCKCQEVLKGYAHGPSADEMAELDTTTFPNELVLGASMHVEYNEPSIGILVSPDKIGHWEDTAGQGLINAYRYTYTNYLGETVSQIRYIKSAPVTGGWDDYVAYGDAVLLKLNNVYILDILGQFEVELLTVTSVEVKGDPYSVQFKKLGESVKYSVAEYYEWLSANAETIDNSATFLQNLSDLYVLVRAAREWRIVRK